MSRAGLKPHYPQAQPRSTWVLDVTPDLDTIMANMKPKWRYNIRLAEKKGVRITHGSPADLDEFYALYAETARRDGFYILAQEAYGAIMNELWRRDQVVMLLGRVNNQLVAVASVVHQGDTAWYLHGASTVRNREVMAPHLLQWEAIKWAKTRGAVQYDFRGVPEVASPGQDLYGVYRFKHGFGGHHVTSSDLWEGLPTANLPTVAYLLDRPVLR